MCIGMCVYRNMFIRKELLRISCGFGVCFCFSILMIAECSAGIQMALGMSWTNGDNVLKI